MCRCVVRSSQHSTPFFHIRESVPISLTMCRKAIFSDLVPLIAGCFCLPQCQWQLLKLTLLLFVQVSMQRGSWCPPPAVVTEMKYCKVIALYATQTGEVHGTALIFSLFHRVTAWLLNPCLTVWIIRKRGINAFNVYTRSKCWLLTRSEKNNEML